MSTAAPIPYPWHAGALGEEDSPTPLGAIATPGRWYAGQLCDEDWRMTVPAAAVDELDRALDAGSGDTPDAVSRVPEAMPALQAFLGAVQASMFHGTGVAVAGRLPVAEWGVERARRAVALMAHVMGPPTQQTHDGVILYTVEDRGLRPGPGVRRSLTNVEQPFHSDGPWVARPPWVVALYCLRQARQGGLSRCVSLRALVEDLASEDAALAERLTRDLWWHRQAEHAAGDTPVSRHPMVWHDAAGRWCGRFYADYVQSGYRTAGEPMDLPARRALERLEALSQESHRWLQYRLEAGDVAWINNRWCVHARTGFKAVAPGAGPRLLMRVWHRLDGDGVALDG